MRTINKILTNGEIYNLAMCLSNSFVDNELYLPAAVNYSIQKNKTIISELVQEIEQHRINIIHHYGEILEDGNIRVPENKVDDANKEINDLLSIEQEIKIYTFKIEEIADVQLTSAQMSSIMFMIEEE